MLSEMPPLLSTSAVSFLFPNVPPMVFCSPREARPRCESQLYLLGSRAALKEEVPELRFPPMHQGSEQAFCLSQLSPRAPELKGSRRDAKALCYLRKRPRHHRDLTLPPMQAPGGGHRCSNLSRPSRGENGAGGAGPGPRSHSRVAKDPGSGTGKCRPGRRRPRAGEGGGSRRPASPIAPSADI